jgi:hypothetical protein
MKINSMGRSRPTGNVHLREWVKKHKDTLGNEYHNELDRRRKKG